MALTHNTDPEHWRRVDALLTEALALAPDARGAWLDALPAADKPLLPMLRRMLSRKDRPGDAFMERPVTAGVLAESGTETLLEKPGAQIGPYRLIRELGSGGMGRVWLAERIDGSLRRQVALKLPRMGWARGVAERLVQERDALAALEHRHIARLYDAGTAQGGRPYIAMEYIEGVPINEYVLTRSLSLRERLQLFQQVTSAVAYAHSHLIVHRDIKPQNILVTADGVAHLLDFGAAKLLGRDDEQHLTRQLGGAMSPDYASPEQIRGDRITVATDVYSLGVLLYELLTGSRPYKLQRVSGAALEEAILKAEIPRASSSDRLLPKYARQLRGDIDAVLDKALRRNPAHRYASVQAMADDIDRHLAGEPVLAQRLSRAYLLGKFIRRHRFGVGAAAGVLLALGIGAAISLWQANVARQEAARAARVKEFVASIFTHAVPKTGVGGMVTARDLLNVAATRLESELANDPAVAAELGVIIARSYEGLGYTHETVPILRDAAQRAEASLGPSAPLTLDARLGLVAGTMLDDPEKALALLQDLIPRVNRDLARNARRAAQALRYQSFVLAKLNRREDSYASLQQGIAIAERHLGDYDEDTIFMVGLLSNTRGRFGDRDAQLNDAREAMRRASRAFGEQRPHNTLIAVERWYADALRENDRPGDAVPILRRVLADQIKLDAAPTQRVRNAKAQLGVALMRIGAAGEALELLRDAAAMERAQNPEDTDDRRGYAEYLAAALALANRVDEAVAQDEYIAELARRLGTEPPGVTVSRNLRRARLLAFDGRPAEARQYIDIAEKLAPDTNIDYVFQARHVRAFVARMLGEPEAALRQLLALQSHPGYATQRLAMRSLVESELGLTYLDLARMDEAIGPLERCQQYYVQAQILPSVRVAGCMVGLARVRLAQKRAADAETLMTALADSWRSANPGSAFHGEALYWLSQAQQQAGKSAEAMRNLRDAQRLLADAKPGFLRALGGRLVEPPRVRTAVPVH